VSILSRRPEHGRCNLHLTEAEAWTARRPTVAPGHSEILLDFLGSSRGGRG
jgi:hypothetical protein